jgi:peptide/nickel transport system permease protein
MGVLVITFFITRVLPSDPALLMAGGDRATPEAVERARERLGLDQPLLTQFTTYIGQIAQGDLGESFVTHRPVIEDIAIFLPATLELILPALLLALIIGIPFGVIAGSRSQSKTDRGIRLFAISGAAIPAFWAGMMGQLIFVSWLALLPVAGAISPEVERLHPITRITGLNLVDSVIQGNWTAAGDVAAHMILPVIALMIHPLSLVMRMTRASVEEVMHEQYVTAARAAGIREREILFRDVLKNAISPTLTVIGLAFASAFTGTLLVEVVFAWPGIGRYVNGAILSSDFPAILGAALVGTLIYVVINFAVDIAQAWLDPRIRATGR